VAVNGAVVAQGSQFSVSDVEVVVATVDVDAVRSYRSAIASRGDQVRSAKRIPRLRVSFDMGHAPSALHSATPPLPGGVRYHAPEEEIALGPACWLWDYLRRSGGSGYFLPLSGGADSGATATLAAIMCRLVVESVAAGDAQTLRDARRVTGRAADDPWVPVDAHALVHEVLHTAYLGTENSSEETRARAAELARQLGAFHLGVVIDRAVQAVVAVVTLVLAAVGALAAGPRFLSQGGSAAEDLALQNVQARLRMVFSYMLAQLLPWARRRAGFLLVLGSANVDECLRGYLTKYDCSAADVNPIGGIAKGDLASFLRFAAARWEWPALLDIVSAKPTAELRPRAAGEEEQLDEADMGMTYRELGVFGRLRKVERCGPLSMYQKLVHQWDHLQPTQVADKVIHFFKFYGINRHKATVLPPAYHAENYSPDDNRFDLRPFLYPRWDAQFRAVRLQAAADQAQRDAS
jgi:NAD+ synthase (glutamine-hydrolysing)